MSDRCTGACCTRFAFTGKGTTPEEIVGFIRENGRDGAQIADMILPLYPLIPGAEYPTGNVVLEKPVGGGWVFTCKHFNLETRDCGIYESRPEMCREYPYRSPCEHGERCTWSLGRAGKWPPPKVHYQQMHQLQWRTHLRVVDENGDRPRTQRVVDLEEPAEELTETTAVH